MDTAPSGTSDAALFVGREQDLARLRAEFAGSTRLVTLVGAGGVGKTRLAREYAARSAGNFPGGTWFVDLSGARSESDVCDATARALGVPPSRKVDAAESMANVARALAARGRGLLVLDNFEQLVEFAPGTAARWLDGAPEIRILVTSRERLRVAGEQVFELAPLDTAADAGGVPSPAARLFLAQARRARGDETYASAPEIVADIVRRLDGIPLAIELAAARTGSLGPSTLRERLSRSIDVLTHGRRDREARQRTLRAAIDWSWELLSESERRALARLSVFVGGFDLEAAERVLDAPGEIPALDALQSLLDKSLLRAAPAEKFPDELRYGMFQTLREYAAEKLASDPADADAAALRHATYYATVTLRRGEALEARGGTEPLERLALDDENLRAALEYLAGYTPREPDTVALVLRALTAVRPFAWNRWPFARYGALLDRWIHAGESAAVSPAVLGAARLCRAEILRQMGSGANANEDIDAAREAGRAVGDARLEGRALRVGGMLAIEQGRFDDAVELCARSLSLAERAGDRWLEAMACYSTAAARCEQGRRADAVPWFERSLAVARAIDDVELQALVRWGAGVTYNDLGRLVDARAQLEGAREAAARGGSTRIETLVTCTLGVLEIQQGETVTAVESLAAGLHKCRLIGATMLEQTFRVYYALALFFSSDTRRALDEVRAAEESFRAASLARDAALGTAFRAGFLLAGGDLDGAARALSEALASLPDPADPHRGVTSVLSAALDASLAIRATPRDEKFLGTAREALARAVPPGKPVPSDVAFALRIFTAVHCDALLDELRHGVVPPARSVRVHTRGWFQLPGGERVDCSGKPVLRAILVALTERRIANPGTPLSTADLVRAAWPGEKMRTESARNRLGVAMNRLKALGLRPYVFNREGGYLFDPETGFTLLRD